MKMPKLANHVNFELFSLPKTKATCPAFLPL